MSEQNGHELYARSADTKPNKLFFIKQLLVAYEGLHMQTTQTILNLLRDVTVFLRHEIRKVYLPIFGSSDCFIGIHVGADD